MNTKTYTILHNAISDYKSKYYNDPCNNERVAIYETQVIRWIKNAKIIGSITSNEVRLLYDYAFEKWGGLKDGGYNYIIGCCYWFIFCIIELNYEKLIGGLSNEI